MQKGFYLIIPYPKLSKGHFYIYLEVVLNDSYLQVFAILKTLYSRKITVQYITQSKKAIIWGKDIMGKRYNVDILSLKFYNRLNLVLKKSS